MSASNPEFLIEGKLDLYPDNNNSTCKAKLSLNNKKIYNGHAILSLQQNVLLISLYSKDIGEFVFIAIHHFIPNKERMLFRIGCMLSQSTGEHKVPNMQRVLISKNSIRREDQFLIEGQLRLNTSSILLSEKNFKEMLSDLNLPSDFSGIFSTSTTNGEQIFPVQPTLYYNIDEAELIALLKEKMNKKDVYKVISIMRNYSESPYMIKTGKKPNSALYDSIFADDEQSE